MIICDDADLAAAASAASMGRFYNCGQACLAIKRVYVFDVGRRRGDRGDRRQGAAAARRASAASPRARWGRCTPRRQRGEARAPDRRERRRESSPAAGARTTRRWRAGGSTSRRWSWSRRRTRRWRREEVFGPALPIWRVRGHGRGARRSPTTRRSGSAPRCGRATSTARSARRPSSTAATRGSTRATKVYDELPFGGLKASGYGKEHGSEAFDFYTDKKSVVVRRGMTYNASLIVDRQVEAGRADKPAFVAPDATLTYERAAPAGQPDGPPAALARRRPRAPRAAGARRHHGVPARVPRRDADRRRAGPGQRARQGRQLPPLRRGLLRDRGADRRARRCRGCARRSRARRCATSCAAARATTSSSSTTALAAQDDELDPGADAPRRHGVLALQLGLDRQAEGRRAPPARHRVHLRHLRAPGARAARGRRHVLDHEALPRLRAGQRRSRSRSGSAPPRC